MKKNPFILVFIFLIAFPAISYAQLLEEWINQKSTQRKYLIVQIGALQTYLGYIKKGYSVVGTGLKTIGQIKNGDFNIHNTFFSSLQSINPKIKKSAKVLELIAAQISLIQYCNQSYKNISAIGGIKPDDLLQVKNIYSGFLSFIDADADLLTDILTGGHYEMTDDQRLQRIDELYAVMKDRRGFIQKYTLQVTTYAQQEKHTADDLKHTLKLLSQ
ncbi:hypothetical protein CLV51_11037 [Chitinophaga niastensis]|uniref:TerB family tellurite resistance protein n=1 Tax=Chitinophaga niastensis TaxID=536980 RepID=A0A2P8H9F4_CHINA|nr:hypothetical protein [Chitinophaga niastensis]PSL42821.1 hypothetical protein CLV51_11037 [Chitinophaga niastensis]